MKTNNIIIILTILFTINCKSQIVDDKEIIVIEVYDISYSKIPSKYDKVLLSKITNIDKKYFSSGISFTYKNKKIDYPINDILFNHEFFNGFDYNTQKKIKLYLQKYTFKKIEYFVAIKIK